MDIEDYDKSKMSSRKYDPEATVMFRVRDLKKLNMEKFIDAVEERIGFGNCFGCVPRHPNTIEVTVNCINNAQIVSDGIEIDNEFISGEILYSRYMVVSILYLPTYIEDEVIADKLENYVELVGPVRRRYYRSNKGCTDGTRYVKCNFPSNISSLPWALTFETLEGPRSFRLIHNNQKKVCHQCLSEEHMIATCPDTQCRRCTEFGHIAVNCIAERCTECRLFVCRCETRRKANDVECDGIDKYNGELNNPINNETSDKKKNEKLNEGEPPLEENGSSRKADDKSENRLLNAGGVSTMWSNKRKVKDRHQTEKTEVCKMQEENEFQVETITQDEYKMDGNLVEDEVNTTSDSLETESERNKKKTKMENLSSTRVSECSNNMEVSEFSIITYVNPETLNAPTTTSPEELVHGEDNPILLTELPPTTTIKNTPKDSISQSIPQKQGGKTSTPSIQKNTQLNPAPSTKPRRKKYEPNPIHLKKLVEEREMKIKETALK